MYNIINNCWPPNQTHYTHPFQPRKWFFKTNQQWNIRSNEKKNTTTITDLLIPKSINYINKSALEFLRSRKRLINPRKLGLINNQSDQHTMRFCSIARKRNNKKKTTKIGGIVWCARVLDVIHFSIIVFIWGKWTQAAPKIIWLFVVVVVNVLGIGRA